MTEVTSLFSPEFGRALAHEQNRDVVELNHYRQEASRARNLSGLQPDPPVQRSPRDLILAAQASAERTLEWKASPQGRLQAAILAVGKAGYDHTCERMRNAFSRGVSMERVPRLVEVAFILSELAGLPSNDGAIKAHVEAGVKAVSELLQHKTEEAA